jgi:hypothetical protein
VFTAGLAELFVQHESALKIQRSTAPDLVADIVRAMGKGTTEPDYRNRNGQMVVRPTHRAGTDHNQYLER